MEILKAENLTKKYINKTALDNLNITLEKGKIYGLLGPNGSGKTTLMKIIAGLLQASSGNIQIMESMIGKDTKKLVSYMPTTNHLSNGMKIKHWIECFHDYFEDFNKEKAQELIDFMKLKQDMKIKNLSTGMVQRLKISLAISRDAILYVFDEPFNGIDPVSREKIMETLLNNLDEEKTIIISSHMVSELERILDRVIFLDDGKLIINEDADFLRVERKMSIDELYREVYKDA
ncbi:ABC-2 type transport system ATP-binding protein [Anaerosolibacter carboniphilus]|uniref:ABC-2 type transport system ATP-binding protein n=1 Tax=Anaerosolibacter carboniphilus TaxID=1417629 RepID=A0A841KZT5_9FIRM|nr:ABC transporter ATP-binding protein [Anaerosolibacter carboniphilus]MBB6217838.1 ABC-2 type transport system ATP-binding protein [Anaerosolibacter carboniphilus]